MPQSTSTHRYAGRLQRLLTLINEIKTNPRQQPRMLYSTLNISSSMFDKDRRRLAGPGFVFRYNRKQRQYDIIQEQFLPVLNLCTSEVLALIMAVRQLSSGGDYTLTYDAIAALSKVISTTPTELRAFFQASLDDVVLPQGFGCDATIVQDLWRACQEHRRRMQAAGLKRRRINYGFSWEWQKAPSGHWRIDWSGVYGL
jgi:predicted DNA-binding transcriptional regulator YafY